MIRIKPNDVERIINEQSVHSPIRGRADNELPRLGIVHLIGVNVWCMDETFGFGGLIEVNDMPAFFIVLIRELFNSLSAVVVQTLK